MSSDKFYITTTLPYVNGLPHLGHTLEFVQADVIARFMKQSGKEVFFNTGTDEHGLKMYEKAQEEGISTQEYVDKNAAKFIEFCDVLNIKYTRFIRTTDEDHIKAAQKFWEASLKNGDIYKKQYEGLYCVGCEEFKTEKDLVDGKCPNHNREPIKHSEENYFFKFSKFQDALLKIYKENSEFIKPSSKLKEMISFVSGGLEDFSISRRKENLPWGIPVPNDSEQVMYVWFDALVNYVTTVGYGENEEEFKKWWPVVQLCGPDNTRFQSAMWQAMLMSAGIEPSKQILVHGMILAEDGTKMSKSLGNVISPFDLIEKYGVEPLRYYLVAGLPTYSDGAFSYEQLEAKYKADLQNNFGNLLNRLITLAKKNSTKFDNKEVTIGFRATVDTHTIEFKTQMFEFNLYEAFEQIIKLTDFGNKYITEQEPWNKTKSPEEVYETLNNLNYLLERAIDAYKPLIQDACTRAEDALTKLENIILFPNLEDKE
jgi:methionyl-tRNA synthetase